MTTARSPRTRLSRRLLLAAGVGLAAPMSWGPLDIVEHARAAALVSSFAVVSLLVVHRPPSPEDRYADALLRAVALRVHLGHVRVATVHELDGRTHAVVTWREAHTVLLDHERRPLASVTRNVLAKGWTMSVRLDEPDVPRLLGPDGGRLELIAAVDTEADPWARIGNSPLRVERCDIAA